MRSKSTTYGYLLVVISSLGFGTVGLWAKWGYQAGFTPQSLLTLRFGIASAMMWLLVCLRYHKIPWPGTKGAFDLALKGGFLYALTAGSLFKAYNLMPAALVSMLFYLHPVLTTVLAATLWHEQTTRQQIGALIVAVFGTALLAGGAIAGDLSPLGVLFTLLGALSYSGFTLNGQSTRDLGSPLVTCAYTTTGCFIFLALWARPSVHWLLNLTELQWAIGLGVALLATVIGIMLFLAGVAIVGASKTAIVAALEPASGVLFSVLLLGERLGFGQLSGMICILSSVIILTLGQRTAESTPEQILDQKSL